MAISMFLYRPSSTIPLIALILKANPTTEPEDKIWFQIWPLLVSWPISENGNRKPETGFIDIDIVIAIAITFIYSPFQLQ